MAEIYLARATGIEGFEKHVVVKRILEEHAADPKFVEMFLDEARLAARLQHHNIAQVYDIGQSAGQYFFSMEYLHGDDLRAVLKACAMAGNQIPLGHVLTIIAGSAAGLHYAHEKKGSNNRSLNIVHRDISPSNIIVTYDGGIKVVDFGIARATERQSEKTEVGQLKGKISYMSPEQCVGRPLDRRSDVFSLGIVFYELATVSRLFRVKPDESEYVVMDRIVNGKIDPPSTRVDSISPELDKIILKALAVDPADRYQTCKDMLIDIENFAASSGIPLSTASLSKFLQETLGVKAEPWNDISIQEMGDATEILSAGPDGEVLEGTVLTITGNNSSSDIRTIMTPGAGVPATPAHGVPVTPAHGVQQGVIGTATIPPGYGTIPPGYMQVPQKQGRSTATVLLLALLLAGAVGAAVFFWASQQKSEPTPPPIEQPIVMATPDAAPVVEEPDAAIVVALPPRKKGDKKSFQRITVKETVTAEYKGFSATASAEVTENAEGSGRTTALAKRNAIERAEAKAIPKAKAKAQKIALAKAKKLYEEANKKVVVEEPPKPTSFTEKASKTATASYTYKGITKSATVTKSASATAKTQSAARQAAEAKAEREAQAAAKSKAKAIAEKAHRDKCPPGMILPGC